MHVMPAVHARVVDQALPPGDRPRLLEIHPHHDEQVVGELVAQAGQAARVVQGRRWIMHRARTGHHKKPVVSSVERSLHIGPGPCHHLSHGRAERQFDQQRGRREQRLVGHHPGIADPRHPQSPPRRMPVALRAGHSRSAWDSAR